MWETLKNIAPTVGLALEGPLGGAFVAALGAICGDEKPTLKSVQKIFEDGKLTSDQIVQIKALEEKAKQDERDNDFRYADLSFRDRDSARRANVDGGTQKYLFALSLVLLVITLGSEVYVLFDGYPKAVPEIIVGRILGLLDAVAMLVLTYWYGTTSGSAQKTNLLAQAEPIK